MDKKNISDDFYCAKSKGKVTRVINGIKMVPERKWVGLSDEETNKIAREWQETPDGLGDLCRAIEAKLKEKNSD